MSRIVAATFIASIALFLWGFVFWTVIEPPLGIMKTAPNEGDLAAGIASHLQQGGTYLIPSNTTDLDAWQAKHEAGPLITVMFNPKGAPATSPMVLIGGYVHMWVSVFLMALLVRWISRYLGSYGQRVGFVVWIGAIEAVFSNLGRPVWYFQPWDYHLFQAAYCFSSWTLVGIILAWFLHGDT